MRLKVIGSNQTQVDFQNGVSVFFSYSTPVAAFVPGQGYLRSRTKYSVTTSKHVNSWIGPNQTEVDQEVIDHLVGG